jgi:hypothetical protein
MPQLVSSLGEISLNAIFSVLETYPSEQSPNQMVLFFLDKYFTHSPWLGAIHGHQRREGGTYEGDEDVGEDELKRLHVCDLQLSAMIGLGSIASGLDNMWSSRLDQLSYGI